MEERRRRRFGGGNYSILDSEVGGKQQSEASKRGLEVKLQWEWRAGED